MGINWSSAWAAGQSSTSSVAPTTTPPPPPTPAPAVHAQLASPAASPSPDTSLLGSIESDVGSLFEGLKGLANDLTAFGQSTSASGSEVGKIGNIGSPQGSNMIKVASTQGYQYTNNFINSSPSTMTVVIWNKAFSGANGVEANLGSCVAPVTPALTFALAPGANQIVAFQEDSQIGWAEATTAKTASGAFDTTWGEANFASGGSGYDMSAILNSLGNVYDMAISATETPCISDMTQNYWYAANNDPNDPQPFGSSDGSCYVPGTGATLTTKMGGSK
jgi:hypothetical protein